MNAESASLMMTIPESKELEFRVVLGPKAQKVKPFRLPIGKGIAGWVAKTGKSILIPDAYKDPRFDPSFDKRSGYVTRSILCVPMIYKNKIIGVMNVLNRKDGKPFTENDMRLFTIFASQAALSVENARLLYAAIEKERLDKELQVASDIQKLIIPQKKPQIPGMEVAAKYIPCKEVSGDFYDIIKVNDKEFIFVVADVSGKGIPGAMVVSTMQASLHAYLEYSTDLISVIAKLNERIISRTTSDRYITFFIGLYNAQKATFTYINAGHNPPLRISKGGEVYSLKTGGVFIGFVKWDYEQETIQLEKNDILVLFTDGLVEAMDNREVEFDEKRLIQILKDNKSKSVSQIQEKIIRGVKDHIGEEILNDDFTLLVLKYKG